MTVASHVEYRGVTRRGITVVGTLAADSDLVEWTRRKFRARWEELAAFDGPEQVAAITRDPDNNWRIWWAAGATPIDAAGVRRQVRHGDAATPLYAVWKTMRDRCHNPRNARFSAYGERGIYVCDEWRHSFVDFRRWAHSAGYQVGLEIDRIDNDGPYRPDNCRWTTSVVNNSNRRSVIQITAFGETNTLADWASDPRCHVSAMCLYHRVRRGWPAVDALTLPKGSRAPAAEREAL